MFAKKLYEDISEGRERLELEYYSTVYSNLEGRKDYAGEMAEEYLSCLQNNLDDDIRAGFTQKGVHRDDLAGKINGLAVRQFAFSGTAPLSCSYFEAFAGLYTCRGDRRQPVYTS